MIISHKHKFIFIKNQKTAGTSLEIALSELCAPEDIITPIDPVDEDMRKSLGFKGAQNYLHEPYALTSSPSVIRNMTKMKYFNHIPAIDVKEKLANVDIIWNDYYKFSFERNPYDKVISWYYFRYRNEDVLPSRQEFIISLQPILTGFDLYAIDDIIALDDVFLYEDMSSALAKIADKIGLGSLSLPSYKAKSKFRKNKDHYSKLINNDERVLIESKFRREIDYFGYKF